MRSPSIWTTRPSMGGNAETTSWSMSPNVAPTWSAMPACAGPASVSAASASAAVALESAAAVLEDDRRLVDTENLPERVTDLTQRHLRADGVEDSRHQVVAA